MYGLVRCRAFFHRGALTKSHVILSSNNNWRFYSSGASIKPQQSSSSASDNFNCDDDGRISKSISSDASLPQSESRRSHYDKKGSVSSAWLEKVVYSTYLEKFIPPRGYKERLRERFEIREMERDDMVKRSTVSPPVSLKYLLNNPAFIDDAEEKLNQNAESSQSETNVDDKIEERGEGEVTQFPYQIATKTEFVEEDAVTSENLTGQQQSAEPVKLQSMAERLRQEDIDLDSVLDDTPLGLSDVFEAAAEVVIADIGTPDPNAPPSNIPCGGCGAFLHCQDQSIPGYISSEKFKKAKTKDLLADVCYRCSVLEAHQATLNVNVSREDYPRIVSRIWEQFAMVLLIVDLTDFPCSIWPEILDIIGSRRPIILIGNKVDLLPQDSPDYLRRIEDSLVKCAIDVGMLEANIIHTALISAKTGYGVEDLITAVFNLSKGKGDIFIMGCTNVGKSSLFNTFLQSDLCKPEVYDVVQKATISQWPGTTLNLLKFPMTDPRGLSKFLRDRRLQTAKSYQKTQLIQRQIQLKETGDPELAVLTGHVGKTFINERSQHSINSAVTLNDIFHVNPRSKVAPPTVQPGQWNPQDPLFRYSHWVYDTPGAVNSNQILDLLTLPELMQSLPKTLIQPRTFFIKPNMSFFIGGLARLDFVDGPRPIRFTLFSNTSLPVTMSLIEDADMVYEQALGTKVFAVPSGGQDRLSQFPALESKHVDLDGTGHNYSCADIVLSSIGWVAVTVGSYQKVRLSVHTPGGKGIFIRKPALLPYAVNYKGKRIRRTYSYMPHNVYTGPKSSYRKQRPRFY